MKRKNMIAFVLLLCLVSTLVPASLAAESFTINGVTVSVSSGINPSNCSDYASSLLKQIWSVGRVYIAQFGSNYNLLRDKSAEERKITEEHVREYIQATPLGSRIRICQSSDTTSNNRDCGVGHTMVLVAKDDSAGKFTVLEGGQGGKALANTYTYAGFVKAKSQHSNKKYPDYFYFYYIADYSAAERDYKNGTNIGATPISSNNTVVITFNPQDGTVSPSSKTCKVGDTYGTLPTPTRDGYDFTGWYSAIEGKYVTSSTIVSGATTTLYARWEEKGPGHWEYRYGGYATTDGQHECWCETYLKSKFGSAVLRYSDWSETQYSANGKNWTCGNCNGTHTGIDHYGSNGLPYWLEYILPDGKSYNWEERRWVPDETANPEKYTVTLDDGSVCSQITVTNGSTYSALPTPSKDGYTFDGWYTQELGGTKITASTTVNLSGNQTLYAHWVKTAGSSETTGGYWGDWSEWSTTTVYPSDTRQVETQVVEKKTKISDGYTEYRYGGYATTDGRHECWCETYLKNKFGSAVLQYSDWSTTRYSSNGKSWTCGQCSGNHIHVDHYTSDGRAWWPEYVLPNGKSYNWEESRTVDAQYETQTVTQYRYRDWISG